MKEPEGRLGVLLEVMLLEGFPYQRVLAIRSLEVELEVEQAL